MLTSGKGISLCDMKNGQRGTVIQVNGGMGILSRLESLGIRKGVVIAKKSALAAKGPVIASASGTEIAMGRGMAARIIVEVHRS